MTKKHSKIKLWSIIIAAVAISLTIALIVTNIFIPIKYIASYCVGGNRAESGTMRVTFVDVGYGDCIIVELPDGKNMLIDAGDGRFSNNAEILKELNRRDIDSIDYLVCSSVNGEHCGGLAEILKYKEVKTAFIPYCKNKYITDAFRNFVGQIETGGAEILYSEYNSGIKTDEYFFTFLSPSVKEYDGGEYAALNEKPSKHTRNNSSAVMWLEYAGTPILFTGDVEASVLDKIALSYSVAGDDYPVKIETCKIVQVAGHGDSVSACAPFYDLIKSEAAIISVGENGGGCPSVEVLSDVINTVGENLYRTDELGTVTIEVTVNGYKVL